MKDFKEVACIFVRTGLLLAILFGGACCDAKEHRIPNWWILVAFFCGMALEALGALGTPAADGGMGMAVGRYLLRVFICAAALFPLFLLRMVGAGDIKLMAVMVGWLGPARGLSAILYGCFVGAVLALVKLLTQGILWQRLNYLLVYLRQLFQTKEIVPYYSPERDGYGVVVPFAFCLFVGYVWYLLA